MADTSRDNLNQQHSAVSYTLLGFDFGMKRIGVAVGQTLTRTANPLPILPARNGIPDWQQVTNLINDWHPQVLIVGKPLNMDGTTQPLTKAAQFFAKNLQQRYHLPVHEVDERLSSVAARDEVFSKGGYRALQNKSVDGIAAQIILLDWMNQHY
jgi:putative Holliday junction resolvase